MHKLLTQRLVIAWIAMLSVLFSAWAPAISHAMASVGAQGREELQVCTMEGMQVIFIANDSFSKSDPHGSSHFMDHCPYCSAHGSWATLPSSSQTVFAVLDVSASYPPLFYQSAIPLLSWHPASPRGPPAPVQS